MNTLSLTQQYLLCTLGEKGKFPRLSIEKILCLSGAAVLELLMDETLAYAAGRWYAVMNARFDGDCHTPDAWHCLTGKTPGQPGFASYCAQQRPKLKKYRLGLAPGPEAQAVDALIERLEGNL